MVRQPSIHITKQKLFKVLKRVLAEEYSDKELRSLTRAIMQEGVKYSLSKRTLNITNQTLAKSTKGIMNTETEDTNLFAHILTLVRRKFLHKGIVQPKPGSKDWTVIQNIIPNVNAFCEDFKLTHKRGYYIYIEWGLKKMGNFYLTNFQSLHNNIVNDYAAVEELEKDMTPARTQKAHEIYSKHLGEMAIVKNYNGDPSKMVYFKRVAETASKLKIEIKHYIAAQFEGLKWANTIPEPQQLVTEAAITRLNKYIVKAGLKGSLEDNKAEDVVSLIQKQWSQLG